MDGAGSRVGWGWVRSGVGSMCVRGRGRELQASCGKSDKGDFMSRSRSLYCHSNTGPMGSTALILREKIRSSLSRPFKLFIRG